MSIFFATIHSSSYHPRTATTQRPENLTLPGLRQLRALFGRAQESHEATGNGDGRSGGKGAVAVAEVNRNIIGSGVGDGDIEFAIAVEVAGGGGDGAAAGRIGHAGTKVKALRKDCGRSRQQQRQCATAPHALVSASLDRDG